MNLDHLTNIINQYINEEILSLRSISTQIIPNVEMKEKFLERLFLRKYRKYAISEDVRYYVASKLNNIIDKGLEMRFVPSFGGYKHWWSPTYPNADWAEVFNIKFLLEYLGPIFNSYKKNKVYLEYESEEVILAELNNISQEGLDRYTSSFRCLLSFFQKLVGDKIELSLTLARDQYAAKGKTKQDLLRKIEEMIPEYTERFEGYDEEDKAKRIKKASTNFKLDGVIDYTKLSDAEKEELFKKSRILNEAFLDADFELRGDDYFENESTIPLLFSFGLGPGGETWLHIGSSSSSMVDFWAGMGILEYREDGRIVQRIISRSQYDIIKDQIIKVEVHSALTDDICIKDETNKNFSYIYVYPGTLIF